MSSLLTREPKSLPGALSDPEELRPFSEIRLIAFDLDGTLIGKADALPGERLAKLISTIGRNTHITLATGRTLTGVSKIIEQLTGLNKLPLVLYNGSVLMGTADQLLITHRVISHNAVQDILASCKSKNLSAFFYSVDPEAHLVNSALTTESVFYLGAPENKPSTDYNGMSLLGFDLMEPGTTKIVAILLECFDAETKSRLEDELSRIGGISVTASSSRYIEIRPAGSSKALGLEELCKRLDITSKQVLAMGDNDNDAELLAWAGISVCVKNASPLARKTSKYFSSYGAGNAAIEVLEIIRRAQRLFKKEKKIGI